MFTVNGMNGTAELPAVLAPSKCLSAEKIEHVIEMGDECYRTNTVLECLLLKSLMNVC